MVGLRYAMLDYTRDAATFEAYDRMSAHQLFIKMGISKRLVDDFIRPTLLVGLFKPPEELSAAVAMELLYYYALAHQTSFDVRWIRSKSISELIVAPMAERLAAATLPPAADAADAAAAGEPALTVSGGSFVQSLDLGDGGGVVGLQVPRRQERRGEGARRAVGLRARARRQGDEGGRRRLARPRGARPSCAARRRSTRST